MIDLGPSDNVALDQPRVAVELLRSLGGTPEEFQSLGPSFFNTFLLDTGANSVLAMQSAVADLEEYGYQTQGTFLEIGVAGEHPLDISVPYRFDFAGTSGIRHTLDDARIMSDAENDFSMFGPWGLVGMPAMVDRVTTLDMSVWSAGGSLEDLFMRVDFADELPAVRSTAANGDRYSVAVDNRIAFDPLEQTVSGQPPIWGDVPFLTAIPTHQGSGLEANFLFDTGAQMSVISERLAFQLGLDANGNGDLADEAQWFETVGGVGGTVSAPVLYIDELRVPTKEGVELVWTDLLWLALDINLPAEAGHHDGPANQSFLTDSTQAWQVDELVGMTLMNLDDGSEGVITANTSTSITAMMAGGSENDWDSGDEYQVVGKTLDGVFGSDLLTSGWVNAFFSGGADGYFQQVHFDFREMDTAGTGTLYFDLSAGSDTVIPPGPGIRVLETLGSTEVVEEGDADEYRVVLTSPPTTDDGGEYIVTVNLGVPDNQVTAVQSTTGLPKLVFDTSNWNIPQVVRVTAVDDNLAEPPQTSVITHQIDTAHPVYQTIVGPDLTVKVSDNDTPLLQIVHSNGSTDVMEGGGYDSFTVRLLAPPTGDFVSVEWVVHHPQLDAVNADPLIPDIPEIEHACIFYPFNWDTPQTVLVMANDDTVSEGPHTASLALLVYDNGTGLPVGQQIVTVHITDNEPWITLAESGGSTAVAEATPPTAAHKDAYTLVLGRQPTAEVVITAAPDSQIDLGAGPGTPVGFTFTTTNWNQPQTVTVAAVDDQTAEPTHTGRIVHTVTSADAGYNSLAVRDVLADIADNDVALVVETAGGTMVSEQGGYDTYEVVLAAEPTADVKIFLRNPDGQVLAVDDANPGNAFLTFDAAHPWNVPQTVRVTAINDDRAEGVIETVIVHEAFSADPRYRGSESVTVTVMDGASVVGRHIFYNNSYFDNNPAAGRDDDNAIASDKQALLPGQTAGFAHYTSYSRGINGIMIDFDDLPGTLTTTDFQFKVGNTTTPDTWAAGPQPTITLRQDVGQELVDRVVLVWPDAPNPGSISKQWLQVTVLANERTGLSSPDVFYFGNAVGDCGLGNTATRAYVDGTDFAGARDNPHNFANRAPVDDAFDFNRDSFVDGTDLAIVRDNNTNLVTALRLFTVPVVSGARGVLARPPALSVSSSATPPDGSGIAALISTALEMGTSSTRAETGKTSFDFNGLTSRSDTVQQAVRDTLLTELRFLPQFALERKPWSNGVDSPFAAGNDLLSQLAETVVRSVSGRRKEESSKPA